MTRGLFPTALVGVQPHYGMGFNVHLDFYRASIAKARATIAALAARGVPVRPFISYRSDDEQRMDQALTTVRIQKVRYAEALADFQQRRRKGKLPC